MDRIPNLSLPYILPGPMQKHVTHNEALGVIDALSQLSVISRRESEPPVSPDAGSRYIVAAPASGDWSGREGQLASRLDGAWQFHTPQDGWTAYVLDDHELVAMDQGVWVPLPVQELQNVQRIGINTSADDTARLAVAAPASLFDPDGAGHRLTINRAGIAETCSVIFQTAYDGHAEIGLLGNDALAFKVSPDGAAWQTAFSIAPETGRVTFAL